jgi:putative aminopeptidase FrvX
VARGLDDRAGTTALLTALGRIDPDALDHKVIFAWSVHEEGGLIGAEAMAVRYGPSARRIYSVDTFVSSDTPLESPHFAFTPLGEGPVLRAIENSGVSPDAERARVLGIAREAGIPLQMGLTQGGTDGTTFTYRGAPNQGLSWPGRYSHSPGEVLDLRDLTGLVDLVEAVAKTGG